MKRIQDLDEKALEQFMGKIGLELVIVDDGVEIPGSFWGSEEAGLIQSRLYVRADTPIHSAMHEACHYICMSPSRRSHLHTNAGGDYDEENGVCYLQLILADSIPGYDREQMMLDMDAWGYSFRLGSAQAWFSDDADDARQWLLKHKLMTPGNEFRYRLRSDG